LIPKPQGGQYARNGGSISPEYPLGAGNPAVPYGVREFKSKFGGMQTNYGRYLLIARPTIYKLGKLGVKAYSRLVS